MITSFVVDRKTWLRGEGTEKSFLLREDHKRCCLGFYTQACGIEDSDIFNKTSPGALWYNESACLKISPNLLSSVKDNTDDTNYLMRINDARIGDTVYPATIVYPFKEGKTDSQIVIDSEETRERLLTEVFARNGITITFEG